ncbi:hypothetical protein J2T60_001618 [Natronospira proteinivora]|uniref:Uncharacterized protein n=1 Tax=Natronospira proteinivora TaxID=1807133 RepID=A0ABT1G8G8_9GAMM|nr:hypothetical protein [Natronospira proteinivora]MCP1727618.1 hypothetical protein [Natronospira proteinivora]
MAQDDQETDEFEISVKELVQDVIKIEKEYAHENRGAETKRRERIRSELERIGYQVTKHEDS